MRPSVCFCVLAGFVLLSCTFDKTEGQDLSDLIGGLTGDSLVQALTTQLVGLWDSGEMEFLDHVCNFQVKPKLKRWQLYFVGTMYCPGWTPIRGTSETRSRTNVINDAVADFVRKAIADGLITEEQARNWLRHQ